MCRSSNTEKISMIDVREVRQGKRIHDIQSRDSLVVSGSSSEICRLGIGVPNRVIRDLSNRVSILPLQPPNVLAALGSLLHLSAHPQRTLTVIVDTVSERVAAIASGYRGSSSAAPAAAAAPPPSPIPAIEYLHIQNKCEASESADAIVSASPTQSFVLLQILPSASPI